MEKILRNHKMRRLWNFFQGIGEMNKIKNENI